MSPFLPIRLDRTGVIKLGGWFLASKGGRVDLSPPGKARLASAPYLSPAFNHTLDGAAEQSGVVVASRLL